MALIVEDGTNVAGAQSYASASDLRDFAELRGASIDYSVNGAEKLLMKAMDALETFSSRWKGGPTTNDQALPWPRIGVIVDGFERPSNEIPRELIYAQLHLAIEAYTSDLQPNANQKGEVTKEKVGPIELTYENPGKVLGVSAFAKPMALIQPLLRRNFEVIRS